MGKKKSRSKQKKVNRDQNEHTSEVLESPSDVPEDGEDQMGDGNKLKCDNTTNQSTLPVMIEKSEEECNEPNNININEQNSAMNNECVQLPLVEEFGRENSSSEKALADPDCSKKTNNAKEKELLIPPLLDEATNNLASQEPSKSEHSATPTKLDESQAPPKGIKVQETLQGTYGNEISNISNKTNNSTPMKETENIPAANKHGLPSPSDVSTSIKNENKELHANIVDKSQDNETIKKLMLGDPDKLASNEKTESIAADEDLSAATLSTANNSSVIKNTGATTVRSKSEINPIEVMDTSRVSNEINEQSSKQECKNDIDPGSGSNNFPQMNIEGKDIKGPDGTSSTETNEYQSPLLDHLSMDKSYSNAEVAVGCTVVASQDKNLNVEHVECSRNTAIEDNSETEKTAKNLDQHIDIITNIPIRLKDEEMPTSSDNRKSKNQKKGSKKQKTSNKQDIKETLKSGDQISSNAKALLCVQKDLPADNLKEIVQDGEHCKQNIIVPTSSLNMKETILDAALPIHAQEVKTLPCSHVSEAVNQQIEKISQNKMSGDLNNEPINGNMRHTEEESAKPEISQSSTAQLVELAGCPREVIQHNDPSDQHSTFSSLVRTEGNTSLSKTVPNKNTGDQTDITLNSKGAETLPCASVTNAENQPDNISQSVTMGTLKDGVSKEDIVIKEEASINPVVSKQSEADLGETANITFETVPVKDSQDQKKAISASSDKLALENPTDTPTDVNTAQISACTDESQAKKQGKINITPPVVGEGLKESKGDDKLKAGEVVLPINVTAKSTESLQEECALIGEPVPEKDAPRQEKLLSFGMDINGSASSGQISPECPITTLTDLQSGETSTCVNDLQDENQEGKNKTAPILSECTKEQAANERLTLSKDVSSTSSISQQGTANLLPPTILPNEPVSEKDTHGQEKISSSPVNMEVSSPQGKTALDSPTNILAEEQMLGTSEFAGSKIGKNTTTQVVTEGLKNKTAKNKSKPHEKQSSISQASQLSQAKEPKTEPETESAILSTMKKKDKKTKHVPERQTAEKSTKLNLQNISITEEPKDPKAITKTSLPITSEGKKLQTNKNASILNECSSSKQEASCNPINLDTSETPNVNVTDSSKLKNHTGKLNNESDMKNKETNAREIKMQSDKNPTLNSTTDKTSERKQQKNKKKGENSIARDKGCSVVSEGTSVSTNEKSKTSDKNQDIIKDGTEPTTAEAHSKSGINILQAVDTSKAFQARTIFMANTCHVCKSVHGGATRLKSCSACQLIAYCSKEHQRKHWKEHKSICQAVQKKIKQGGLQNLFADAYKITDPEEWRKYRCYLLVDIEKNVGRLLQPFEREMFLYPRVCYVCHVSDPERLKVCKDCHYINYCCKEHLPKSHHIWCKDLKLLLEINQYQSNNGFIKPQIPTINPEKVKEFPRNMKDFISSASTVTQDVSNFNLYESALSDISSYPLTLLYVMNFLHNNNYKNFFCGDKLTVHLVGAENQFEVEPLSKWDVFLLNLLPKVTMLHIVFIGPELIPSNFEDDGCDDYKMLHYKTIDPSKNLSAEFYYGKLYHDYAKESNFIKPDIICSFNCGIYRLTGFDNKDTWGPTISAMVEDKDIPIVLTAYTEVEAPKDVLRFKQKYKITELISPMENPFASMRPNLNFVSDDETPLIFKNRYLSVIKRGD